MAPFLKSSVMKRMTQTFVALSSLWMTVSPEAGEIPSGDRMLRQVDTQVQHSLGHAFRPLCVNDTLQDLLTHPAFAGHNRLLLPWDDRPYDGSMSLGNIGALLPYHTRVEPTVVVDALNHMIHDVNRGKTVFFDFYTPAQKQADRTKAHTGLFYFHGAPGAPFAVIAPGGGFSYVGSLHEGFPYAQEISRRGYNAFVIKYRVGQGEEVATQDLAAALTFIFSHATTLGLGTRGYSLWGSSAGARMAARIGSHGAQRFGGANLPKPSTVVMAYTGHSDHTSTEPATFVVVGEDDGIAPPAAMESRIAALRALGTDVEYRKLPGVAHGFGAGTGTRADGWIDEAIGFWVKSR